MNIKIALTTVIVLLAGSTGAELTAQVADSVGAGVEIFAKLAQPGRGGAIVKLQGDEVESVITARANRTRTPQIANGWRIRIVRDSRQDGRSRADHIVQTVKNEYPGTAAYASYEAPYWYVAVGDYRTRDDAEKMKRTLLRTYPTASLINTTINLPPL